MPSSIGVGMIAYAEVGLAFFGIDCDAGFFTNTRGGNSKMMIVLTCFFLPPLLWFAFPQKATIKEQ